MNKIYEKITEWLGSTWFIGLFAAWLVFNTYTHREYIHFISELAILIGLLILRAENVQANRMERYIKEAKKDVKYDIGKSDTIIAMLKEKSDGKTATKR